MNEREPLGRRDERRYLTCVQVARFRTFAWGVLATTLAVILWGAYVRATGSGAGCGSHWPTCNGEIIPHPKRIETLIEFTHRATSGLVSILAVVELVLAFRAFPRRHRVRRAAALTTFFMATEGLVGAGLVLFEHVAHDASLARAGWMAAHLVNTFLLVASMTLTAHWAGAGTPLLVRGRAGAVAALGAVLVATLFVGTTGAVVALGDTLFPAKSLAEGLAQDFSSTAHLLIRLRIWHPLAAVLTAALALAVAVSLARSGSPSTRRAALAAIGAVGLQVVAGFVNLALLAPIAMQLVHLLLADLAWIALVLLAATVLGDGAPSEATAPVAAPAASA